MRTTTAFVPFYFRFFALFLSLSVFTVAINLTLRLYLLWNFGNADVYNSLALQSAEALALGALFDIKLVALSLSPFYLFSLALIIPGTSGLRAFWLDFSQAISQIFLFLFFTLGILNIFYYRTFQNPFNDFIFAVAEGETQATLQTIWQDYPMVIGPILIILGFIFVNKLYVILLKNLEFTGLRVSLSRPRQNFAFPYESRFLLSLMQKTFLVGLSFVVFVICARGSVVILPLTRNWARVSKEKIINDIIPNAPYAIYWASRDHFQQKEIAPQSLQQGYDLYLKYYRHFQKMEAVSLKLWQPEAFYTSTEANEILDNQPPLVVFSLIEGLGSHLQHFKSPEFAILGGLDKHFKEDYFFANFISGGDGTFPSLIRLMLSSRNIGLPNSKYRQIPFQTSITRPYKQKGYKTYYMASGNSAWRKLDQFLPALGFDEIIDAVELKRIYSEAPSRSWGTDDEFVYRQALKVLKEAHQNKEKVFIFLQTISNHPPYSVPNMDMANNLNVPSEALTYFTGLSQNKINKVVRAYQYSNYAFAQFMDDLKKSSVAESTIVAATGDHNLRELKYKNVKDYAWWHKTPFYMYVPKLYSANLSFNHQRFGSHRDIFPTLFNISLSEAKYLNLGQNMLSPNFNEGASLAIGDVFSMNSKGAYFSGDLYAPWADNKFHLLSPASSIADDDQEKLTPSEKKVFSHIRTYNAILDWLTAYEVHRQNEK